jgi:prolyl-tRNA editing enzyme YbaK/EbsC (Cys-tRNA(Pro) deacylase)
MSKKAGVAQLNPTCKAGAVHQNAARVHAAAEVLGLAVKIRQFPEGTKTATDAAAAIGVEVGQIVKSLIFAVGDNPKGEGEVVVALIPGDRMLDVTKLAVTAGTTACWRVDADTVRAATGYPIGGVAPLGYPKPLRVFADPDLFRFAEVWAAAGTWNDVFGTEPKALVAACGATLADLAAAPS